MAMAIITRFTRDERFFEIDGCPLRDYGAAAPTACGACRFNVACPGEAAVGCVVNTGFAVYDAALQRLAATAADDQYIAFCAFICSIDRIRNQLGSAFALATRLAWSVSRVEITPF